MIDDANTVELTRTLNRAVRRLLKEAVAATDFDKHVRPVRDEEDGDVYYTIDKSTKLQKRHIDAVDNALIDSARLFSSAGLANRCKYYRRVSRMVLYAFYEMESREMLENEMGKWSMEEVSDE